MEIVLRSKLVTRGSFRSVTVYYSFFGLFALLAYDSCCPGGTYCVFTVGSEKYISSACHILVRGV